MRNLSPIRQQQSSAAVSVTVEPFREYPNLPSDKSDTEPDMTETRVSGVNLVEMIMRKMEQMELQVETLKR